MVTSHDVNRENLGGPGGGGGGGSGRVHMEPGQLAEDWGKVVPPDVPVLVAEEISTPHASPPIETIILVAGIVAAILFIIVMALPS